ncbi:MAG: hypothetical protein HUU15_00655 [Candidatus Brocadiae bacterium]|nr:hypothetical protein [Candidatus Brocadiia bacterium]
MGRRGVWAVLAVLAGCTAGPKAPARTEGERAEGLRAAHGIELLGAWRDTELLELRAALACYPNRDFSGVTLVREVGTQERGGQYHRGRIAVREASMDVLVHELGHAVHSRCPGAAEINAALANILPFDSFHRVSSWEDGTDGPRAGFVSPYAAMDVNECVAESLAAVKLWVAEGRGPLADVDWTDQRFQTVYEILSRHNLLTEEDWGAIRWLRMRR